MTHQQKMHIIHFIDSIYFGQLNNSYQKDGFGIQQTCNFDTYIGYWKNNKAEGLGLVILANGTVIYGNFVRDDIDGLAIISDGNILRCGVFRNKQIMGVGFQYNYNLKIWKMNKYHKGIAIENVKEEICDIASSIPKIINIEQQIYFHIYNFINKAYFPSLHLVIIDETIKAPGCFYGYKSETGFYGPGLILDQNKVVEAGFYQESELNGYGMRRSIKQSHFQIGCYNKGRKDGYFLERQDEITRFFEYRKGSLLKNVQSSQKQILKNQKRYNYNCKDFFSAKNSVPFHQFQLICLPTQVRLFQEKKADVIKNPIRKSDSTKKLRSNNDYVIKEQLQKSSVQIMREKMSNYYEIVTNSHRKGRQNQYSPARQSKSPKKEAPLPFEQDDDYIAVQENPFTQTK